MRKHLRWGAAVFLALIVMSGLGEAKQIKETPTPEEQEQTDAEKALQEEDTLKSGESFTKVFTVNGRNFLFFAQNSPEWKNLLASKDQVHKRTFGNSGCAVAALANLTVNALPMERLPEVLEIAKSTVCFDTYTLANYYNREKGRFVIRNNSDFLRFWPLVLGNITAENNTLGIRENRNSNYYPRIFESLGLRYQVTDDRQEMLDALDQGALAATCSSGVGSPYAMRGHYLTYAAKDDEYIYILDSYVRTEFPKDTHHVIEVIEPGLERVKISELRRIQTGSMYVIWPEKDFVPYTEERLNAIIAKSNAHE